MDSGSVLVCVAEVKTCKQVNYITCRTQGLTPDTLHLGYRVGVLSTPQKGHDV